MRFVVFGLAVSSSWGNGHASLWRGLIKALVTRGHAVTFFERDAPYYASHRDLHELPGATLILYPDWAEVRAEASRALAEADVAIVTSFCPDGVAATRLVRDARALRLFYDLDTPVTLAAPATPEVVAYLDADGLAGFDLVLSCTGGEALDALRNRLGARRAAPFYAWADPDSYRAVTPQPRYAAALSYLGTYAADRQGALQRLLIAPAGRRQDQRFVIGGALYPGDFPRRDNISFVRHLPPSEHCAFYSSARITLNITRAAMAAMGWCPSGRLFEAACCGTPILSDGWAGLDQFFEPEREILVAATTDEAMAALDHGDGALAAIAHRARERVLADHTAERRADALVALVEGCGR